MINDKFWKGKKVLITGHTGFKGSWLSLWLSKLGSKIVGISLKPETSPNLFDELKLINDGNLSHNIFDINNIIRLKEIFTSEKPEIVFHFAAQPLVRESYKNPVETWQTNVIGSLNILEAVKEFNHKCILVMITTDKVYKNNEWEFGYRENDPLGGYDPYSSSKAGAEIAIASWRSSFCGTLQYQNPRIFISTARSGNVIGGGDWSKDRIVPDFINAALKKENIKIRNPDATRPWQHVLEPLSGYLKLAEKMDSENLKYCSGFNFGPYLISNKSVYELVLEMNKHFENKCDLKFEKQVFHEAKLLNLQIEKAYHYLNWEPKWNFEETISRTVNWYKMHNDGLSAMDCCLSDINQFLSN